MPWASTGCRCRSPRAGAFAWTGRAEMRPRASRPRLGRSPSRRVVPRRLSTRGGARWRRTRPSTGRTIPTGSRSQRPRRCASRGRPAAIAWPWTSSRSPWAAGFWRVRAHGASTTARSTGSLGSPMSDWAGSRGSRGAPRSTGSARRCPRRPTFRERRKPPWVARGWSSRRRATARRRTATSRSRRPWTGPRRAWSAASGRSRCSRGVSPSRTAGRFTSTWSWRPCP